MSLPARACWVLQSAKSRETKYCISCPGGGSTDGRFRMIDAIGCSAAEALHAAGHRMDHSEGSCHRIAGRKHSGSGGHHGMLIYFNVSSTTYVNSVVWR